MVDLWERDAWELADDVRAGRLKSREILDACLERIERGDGALNAVCHLDREAAERTAADVDRRVAEGEDPGPLAGVPFLVKETHAARGMPWTEGSLIYADRVADHDEEAVARVRAAGAIVAGKATAPEFGSLNFTRTRIHGTTGNPWNRERTPGGSSGGSAAAVAAGFVPLASGGDGGGSIRIPAAFCGLFGFKGSQGRVPHGPGPFDTSLTVQYGPMARSVRDAARGIDVMCGPNASDPTSLPKPERPYEDVVVAGEPAELLRGRTATWSSTFGYAICDPQVEEVVYDAAVDLCRESGITLVDLDVDIPRLGMAWGLVSAIDMVAAHGRHAEGRYDDLTPWVRLGFEALDALDGPTLVRAMSRRQEVIDAWTAVLAQVDVVLSPTVAVTAFAAEGPPPFEIGGRPVSGTGATPYTMPANLAGTPASSIPVGFVDGLPVGLQVCARRHE
ncbi:MAG TPA: amidase, partial [Acidimicrobiia bacterium]|nr:amidase [Acidimicrobiia bacterium]